MSEYDKFVTPNLNRVSPFTTVDDKQEFNPPTIAARQEMQVVQKLATNDSSNPITLAAIGIGLLSLAAMLGVRVQRGLQPATVLASSSGLGPLMPMNTASALGDHAMEMQFQDSAAVLETRPEHKVKSNRVGWGQLSSKKSRPLTFCYAQGRTISPLNVMKRRRKRLANQDRDRMRLNVFRSNNHIYAQVIDDKEGNTLCAASTLDKSIKEENPKGNDQSAAGRVGALLAERAKAKGLEKLYFDRFSNSGNRKYLFHGRVKALVDAVREGGIKV
jgi:large subunit ribosomal protein L18